MNRQLPFRLYSDITIVPLLSRPFETGTVIFPHSIAPHGSHVMGSVAASTAETEAGGDTVPASAVVHSSTNAVR